MLCTSQSLVHIMTSEFTGIISVSIHTRAQTRFALFYLVLDLCGSVVEASARCKKGTTQLIVIMCRHLCEITT